MRATYEKAVAALEDRVEHLLAAELPGLRTAIGNFAKAVGEPDLGNQRINVVRDRLTDKTNRDDKSPELETKIGSLLDHLSSKRIAEEQDSANYNQRTRQAFERTAERARSLADGGVKDLVKTVCTLRREDRFNCRQAK